MTGDFKKAEVWVSILNGDETQVLESLNKHIVEIQRVLNSKIVMKFVPKIVFKIDHSRDYAEKIDNIFKSIEDE
ncbi:MAG: seg [candidate division CPR2 bacterium GW2011_GWC1_39_9]|nr:MAG: seg [candidate division CPR2 bacterium GW2011_GWC1_39_9]